jgi:HlyD family secretion protein
VGDDAASDIRKTIGLTKTGGGEKKSSRTTWIVIAVVGAVVLAGIAYLVLTGDSSAQPDFTTAKLERGDLTVTVSAVGELAPLNQVDVGTEVSGTIDEVLVDNNDRVTAGQLLARINTDQLEAQVRGARANLASAEARVVEAEATIADARRTLDRTRELRGRGVATQEALDMAQSAHDRAVAALASARAQVEVSQANLATAETSLGKAEIYSPVDGVVLDRKVDPGQTVIAQMQTPVLFTLAEDLAEMELKVAIDEADVGQVQAGQTAVFTVDAYPNRRFAAEITRVRFAATSAEGVVTYETLMLVKNEDLALRPGMTASAIITVSTVKDALLAPNEALRFRPADWGLGPLTGFPAPPEEEEEETDALAEGLDEGVDGTGELWILKADKPQRVVVEVGATDGRNTIVNSDELAAGDTLILGLDEDDDRRR